MPTLASSFLKPVKGKSQRFIPSSLQCQQLVTENRCLSLYHLSYVTSLLFIDLVQTFVSSFLHFSIFLIDPASIGTPFLSILKISIRVTFSKMSIRSFYAFAYNSLFTSIPLNLNPILEWHIKPTIIKSLLAYPASLKSTLYHTLYVPAISEDAMLVCPFTDVFSAFNGLLTVSTSCFAQTSASNI